MTDNSRHPVDRRTSIRRDIRVPIYITPPDTSSVILGKTQDISLGGIKMKSEATPNLFQIGDKLIFLVSEDYLRCEGQGQIAWTSPTGGTVGIKFTQLDEDGRRHLDKFLRLFGPVFPGNC